MPLHSEKWSRKRKIDHGSEWRPLYMHPRPTTRATGGAACSSAVLEASGSRDEGASALQGSGAGHLSSVPAGRDEEAGDEGAFGVAAAGGKLSGGKININVRNASALLPDPAHLPHYKLVKLFKSFRLQNLQKDHRPLKIVRASHQYMYDNTNSEYIDCVNFVSHVGHCHPSVVRAAYLTNNLEAITPGWDIDWGEPTYPQQLRHTLPEYLDTFLFCNSGSEAVDLSLQLSQLYTGGTEAVVTDNAFHGSIDSVHHLSPKVFKTNNITKADWVHIIPMPDLYRGEHRREDPAAIDKYLAEAREVVQGARQAGKVACFISEPMLIIPGCIMPPSTWLQEVYKLVRESGGLCIADEVQTGLGRLGSHFWSFQAQEVNPDIVIIGKTIGNGYPMASVITSKEIAAVLGDRAKEYRCSQVMNAVGSVVLEGLRQEHLMETAASVGTFLLEELLKLQHKHEYIGDVRGRGLMVGMEVVWSRQSRKPAQEIAELIVNKMREEYVILANEGQERNILMVMPPMCFTQENAISLIQRLDKVLTELPKHRILKEEESSLLSYRILPGICEGRLGIIQPQKAGEEEDDSDGFQNSKNMDLEYRQSSYHDLD
ncbi:5-phosphohydroxy-L-lysine phospho-lyase-like isoform X1 [Portunus trituberculatus]|uniref:5-phosphohydroxy-L-lysine phospho-lyase-like isoform X1 n=1 Tax=Portunus trituberculatus TaxID=210409 RepID=UPI001E1D0FE2|nr:5-phosphohydroxy-L-lysine phospho-lyase-like isoform X1 [Portunus trituberculatus]XP_045121104.1 5-phosphohydroxy-L-lysine phospho-lyase-like isoform X1 [Portunus trituberculatus]XP_045121105.1 5-phosphohydroxy-L-lysine phospho-lyase-like isoform X1 [Portunus trituberculatus]XP_045121106.1 5-phosphohydroxy-L-lysine phospho-lyase-like isoform X1 [Portunus trituberculatus]